MPSSDTYAAARRSRIKVSQMKARRQARDYGVAFHAEVKRLVVHGTLHLMGYRDSTPSLKARMSRREDYYLASL